MNALKTAVLLGLLSALLLVGGQALGGQQGLTIALVLAVVMNITSYFFSDRIALASYSAQPVTPTENSQLYARVYPVVHGLAMRMGIPMPKLWLIPRRRRTHSPPAGIRIMPRLLSQQEFCSS